MKYQQGFFFVVNDVLEYQTTFVLNISNRCQSYNLQDNKVQRMQTFYIILHYHYDSCNDIVIYRIYLSNPNPGPAHNQNREVFKKEKKQQYILQRYMCL